MCTYLLKFHSQLHFGLIIIIIFSSQLLNYEVLVNESNYISVMIINNHIFTWSILSHF